MIGTGEPTVRAGRHQVRVSIEGSVQEKGLPLLLINGLGGHVRMWDPLRRHVPDVRTIAFDAPGTGGSPTPALPLGVAGSARMITKLLDELGLDQVDVLGYSLGGMIAQQLAWTSPRRVRRVVLLSTNTGWGSVPSRSVGWSAGLARYFPRALRAAHRETSLISAFFSVMKPTAPVVRYANLLQNLWNEEYLRGYQALTAVSSSTLPCRARPSCRTHTSGCRTTRSSPATVTSWCQKAPARHSRTC